MPMTPEQVKAAREYAETHIGASRNILLDALDALDAADERIAAFENRIAHFETLLADEMLKNVKAEIEILKLESQIAMHRKTRDAILSSTPEPKETT